MSCVWCVCMYFFFSSRRRHTRCALVTGVQTCALPISWPETIVSLPDVYQRGLNAIADKRTAARIIDILADHGWLESVPGGAVVAGVTRRDVWARSEERRVGKEWGSTCRSRWCT